MASQIDHTSRRRVEAAIVGKKLMNRLKRLPVCDAAIKAEWHIFVSGGIEQNQLCRMLVGDRQRIGQSDQTLLGRNRWRRERC